MIETFLQNSPTSVINQNCLENIVLVSIETFPKL